MTINTSEATLSAAQEVLKHNDIVRTTDAFEVYAVPATLPSFSAYALLLFKAGFNPPEENVPQDTMIIPITVNGRKGYFIDSAVANSYNI